MGWFSCKKSSAMVGMLDQGVVSATTFITNITLASGCLKSEYGLYYLAITLLPLWDNLRLAFISTPLTVFLPREIAEQDGSLIGASLMMIVLLAFIGVISTCMGAIIIGLVLDDHALARALAFSSVMVAAHILQRYLRGVFHARLRNHLALIVSVVTGLLQLAGVFLLYTWDRLIAANAVMAIGVAGLIGASTGLILLWSEGGFHFSKNKLCALWRKNRQFGRWLLWKSIAYTIMLQSLPWVLKYTRGATSVAVYAACVTIVNAINPLWIGFTNSLGPRIAHAFSQNGVMGVRLAVGAGQKTLIPMTGLFTLAICVNAERLLGLLYGVKYAGSGLILAGLSVALFIFICTVALEQSLLTLEKTSTVFFIHLLVLCLCLPPVVFLIHTHGIQGVVAGNLTICVVIGGLRLLFYYKEIKNAHPFESTRITS